MLGSERQIIEAYVKTGQVRLLFNPVLNHGDRSIQTHQAAECAADQGQFWGFREFMFENQGSLWGGDVRESVKTLAAQFGLNMADFNACIDDQRHLALVQNQDTRRIERGIRFQPSFEINGEFLLGSQPYEVFETAIKAQLGL